MRALEDAFLTMTMFNDNLKHYWFITEANGDFSGVSFVARLPANFPGVGRYGDHIVRRVTFATQPSSEGNYELVMNQAPMNGGEISGRTASATMARRNGMSTRATA